MHLPAAVAAGDALPPEAFTSKSTGEIELSPAQNVGIAFQAGDTKREIRVLTKAFSESIVPEQVVDRALVDAIAAMKLADVRTDPSR